MRFRKFPAAVVFFVSACALSLPAQTLRQEADKTGMLIGTAVRPSQFAEPAYAEALAREFNMVEPEDAMKWHTVRPDATSFDFSKGDEIVRFAQAHQMKVRGHCLVWGHDNPTWLTEGHYTPRQLSRLLHNHISAEVTHYKGQVFAWDVVNEAFDEKGKLRGSIWYDQPGIGLAGQGTAYIEQALRWAHKADPHALLFYNEAEGEGLNHKSDAIYAMVRDFKRRRVPLDGVGLQMHISNLGADVSGFAANIARLSALGVQVHITELDVALPVDAHGDLLHTEDAQRQAELYRGIVRACLQSAGCMAIQTWGFTDKYSWIGWYSKGSRGQALPLDRNYQPKSAHAAILEELAAGRPANH